MGDCRLRYPTSEALAADAGMSAVAVESGKRKTAAFRWACDKRLIRTVGRAWSRVLWRIWHDRQTYDPPATGPSPASTTASPSRREGGRPIGRPPPDGLFLTT